MGSSRGVAPRGRAPGAVVRGASARRSPPVGRRTRARGHRDARQVQAGNAPGVRALLEEWRLTPAGSGTHVRWTFAADGPAAFRLALTVARPGLGHSFRTVVRTLDARLGARSATGR
ncbi:SRPBCC family protein [Streptomyces erythrochromogenes]|uniref:SRPBCC family protein n=1 Tax=Streptomyces erythrochromogenes TaxID=285574 RepID=UPI003698B778